MTKEEKTSRGIFSRMIVNAIFFPLLLIIFVIFSPETFYWKTSSPYSQEIIIIVIIFFMYMYFTLLTTSYWESKQKETEELSGMGKVIYDQLVLIKKNRFYFLAFIGDVFIGVFIEELIFRGWLFDYFTRAFGGFIFFFLFSAFIFGLSHLVSYGNLFSFFNAFFFGMLYNIAFMFIGFWICYILHLLWNFTLFGYLYKYETPKY